MVRGCPADIAKLGRTFPDETPVRPKRYLWLISKATLRRFRSALQVGMGFEPDQAQAETRGQRVESNGPIIRAYLIGQLAIRRGFEASRRSPIAFGRNQTGTCREQKSE